MKFKANKIALLMAGLSFSAMAIAAPVTPTEIEAARSGGSLQQAWITGASAPTRTVYEGWVVGCEADTNAIFTTQALGSNPSTDAVTPGSLGNFTAYACKRAGRVSVLYHTLDGGSLNAYSPHTIGAVLSRIKYVGAANCSSTTRSFVDAVNSANNATVYKGCQSITGGVSLPTSGSITSASDTNTTALATDPNGPSYPVGGYSDVEASLFAPSIGGGNVSSKGVEANVGVGQVFGIAVSLPLYRAMQAAQNITESGTDYNPTLAPNITYSQYVGLIAQGPDKALSLLVPNNTSRLNIERRVDTSGTQASSNAFFLRNPCSGGVASTLSPTTDADNIDGVYRVTLNSGSGDVKNRLTTASNATVDNDKFAIGVLSAENNWRTDSSTSAGYRYLKLDGVHPETADTADRARLSAVNASYKFHMEMKSFVRADNLPGKAAKTTFEAGIIPAITAALRNPLSAACATFPRGLTLIPPNGARCTVGAQVSKVTNGGKNCAAPIQYFN